MPGADPASARKPEKTILVVEDDEVIRETLSQLLEDHGYPVVTAQHGKEALERLEQLPFPCLMLMDLMMPVMNGWELLAAIRKDPRWSGLPVIVLSAGGEAHDLLSDAHVRFLKKPLRMVSLLDAVRECASE
jgi:CheY-like chemotaxis protein